MLGDLFGGLPLRRAMAAILPLLAAHAGLLYCFDLGRRPGLAMIFLFLAFLAWIRAYFVWEKAASTAVPSLGLVLGVAALLRFLLLPLPPTLSDDTLRYVWDGRVLAAGFDPYQLAPEAEELAPLRDELWENMPHREVPTVYPPLALLFFTVASRLPEPLIAVKILLFLADLLGCALLYRLARQLELPVARVLLYAWNPLVVLETAGMGHVDALMATCTIAAVLLLIRGRVAAAGAAAAGAVLAKLIPVLVLPFLLRRSPRPWIFAAVTTLILVAATLPILVTGGLPRGLLIYGQRWEFNGPLFEPLWRLVALVDPIAAIKSGLDWLKQVSEEHELVNRFYPLVYPQLLVKLGLATGLLLFLFWLWRQGPHPAIAAGRVWGAFLLCSATLYPWYLVAILPWAALCRRRSWLLASALVPLSYLPQKIPGLALFPGIFLLIWLPVGLLLLKDEPWSFD